MRHTLVVIFLAMFLQINAQETFKGEPFIEVSGTAEMEIDPNEVTLWIRLREFEENKNKVHLEKLDQEFLVALKSAGIDRKRLTLADAGSNLSKLGKKEKDAFREKTYELVLTSSAELEKLLEKIEPVKVSMIRITRIHHTEMEKLKMDVKVKALQAARTKAEVLAKSLGHEAGKPLMIREWDEGPVYPMPHEANVLMKAGFSQDDAAEEPVPFRKIRLRGQVTAQFEIN